MAAASRRGAIGLLGGLALAVPSTGNAATAMIMPSKGAYGRIGGLRAAPGKSAELASILLDGSHAMPGCLHYLVAADAGDPDLLWISEVWDSKASHDASLDLPQVQAAIARGRPLIVGFDKSIETRVFGDSARR